MSIAALSNALPAYASDLKHNLDALAAETLLTEQQKWGCFLACAYALGVPAVVTSIQSEVESRLSAEATSAAKAAAAILGMNTVYYSAVNLLANHDYRGEPSRLSMDVLAHPGVDKIDFDMWSLAVSAVSQCGACLNAHEAELHKRGVTIERVQAVLRIAAVMSGVSLVLRGEVAGRG